MLARLLTIRLDDRDTLEPRLWTSVPSSVDDGGYCTYCGESCNDSLGEYTLCVYALSVYPVVVYPTEYLVPPVALIPNVPGVANPAICGGICCRCMLAGTSYGNAPDGGAGDVAIGLLGECVTVLETFGL